MKGWWVGLPGEGGFLVRAPHRSRALSIGLKEMRRWDNGIRRSDLSVIRVRGLDDTGDEGLVEWEEGKRLGAVGVCSYCGAEFANIKRHMEVCYAKEIIVEGLENTYQSLQKKVDIVMDAFGNMLRSLTPDLRAVMNALDEIRQIEKKGDKR